jgi:hypothetical protein
MKFWQLFISYLMVWILQLAIVIILPYWSSMQSNQVSAQWHLLVMILLICMEIVCFLSFLYLYGWHLMEQGLTAWKENIRGARVAQLAWFFTQWGLGIGWTSH